MYALRAYEYVCEVYSISNLNRTFKDPVPCTQDSHTSTTTCLESTKRRTVGNFCTNFDRRRCFLFDFFNVTGKGSPHGLHLAVTFAGETLGLSITEKYPVVS